MHKYAVSSQHRYAPLTIPQKKVRLPTVRLLRLRFVCGSRVHPHSITLFLHFFCHIRVAVLAWDQVEKCWHNRTHKRTCISWQIYFYLYLFSNTLYRIARSLSLSLLCVLCVHLFNLGVCTWISTTMKYGTIFERRRFVVHSINTAANATQFTTYPYRLCVRNTKHLHIVSHQMTTKCSVNWQKLSVEEKKHTHNSKQLVITLRRLKSSKKKWHHSKARKSAVATETREGERERERGGKTGKKFPFSRRFK